MPDREKVIKSLTDIEQIMVCRQEICPHEELQYWIELQEGVADAIAMLKEQEHKDKMFHALEDDWKRLKELLKEQPEIVRCKDCKHHLECDYWIENGDDWFCADGERKQ